MKFSSICQSPALNTARTHLSCMQGCPALPPPTTPPLVWYPSVQGLDVPLAVCGHPNPPPPASAPTRHGATSPAAGGWVGSAALRQGNKCPVMCGCGWFELISVWLMTIETHPFCCKLTSLWTLNSASGMLDFAGEEP